MLVEDMNKILEKNLRPLKYKFNGVKPYYNDPV